MGTCCKDLCKRFPGYTKGFSRYAEKGNVACVICRYNIPPSKDSIRCDCCGQQYRKKTHYPLRDMAERERQVIRIS